MKILFDTNVVLDVMQKRQPHYGASNQVLCLARRGVIEAAVASHTIANLFYLHGAGCLPFLKERLLEAVDVAAADAYGVKEALRWGFGDLEDALQAAAAQAWKASYLVTRNVQDFKRSPVPALTPAAFISRFVRA